MTRFLQIRNSFKKWQPGTQRCEVTGFPDRSIRSLRCAPFPVAIVFLSFVILVGLSAVLSAIPAQAAAPLTLKASTAETPKKQTPEPASKTQSGTFGVKQVDPFRKDTPQNAEKRPNVFQEILDRPVELPKKKRPPAPPKKTEESSNPFEDTGEWGDNPFKDADDPFGGGSGNSSDPFAAGNPFADETPRSQTQNTNTKGAANSNRNPKAGEKEIRDCFDRYKKSLLDAQGEDAFECIDQKTISYYESLLDDVKFATRQKIEQMPLMHKMTVLMIRHQVPEEMILSMSGKELFVYAVENGMIGKDSVANVELGTITVTKGSAKTKIISNGKEAPFGFAFTFEDGQWRMDITSAFPIMQKALKAVAQQQGMSDNDFIFSLLETLTNKKPSDSIWEPLIPAQ
ncbi:MAG: hypothetical protein FWC43_01740 [Planctomycetaceae bacterium]|nr:hypothetical protein [Planctomycetaceae bacterium]